MTLLAHGLAGAADDCRPWAQALPGTRVLVELRGHGRSPAVPEGGWDYDTFVDDLAAVADDCGARQAVAVSVSACAVLRWLTRDPGRFDRLVLALPAALDAPRSDDASERLADLGRHAAAGDSKTLAAGLLAELPAGVADTRLARIWAARRASRLVAAPPPLPRPDLGAPVPDVGRLGAVTADVLVLAEEGDPLHPVVIAERVVAALPRARLEVLPHGALHWTARDQTAALMAAHLS